MTTEHDRFEVETDFAFIGRTFAEYRRLFGLDDVDLEAGRILDCPAGPGSFVAEAAERGASVVGADVMYGRPPGALERRCEADYERVVDQLESKRELFRWDFYGDVSTRARYLRSAYERFLADYGRGGRYVAAALPGLPFATDAFRLVLSGHFLFLYSDRLDRAFHVAALRELARVAAGEVRVFPLAALDTERSPHLDDAITALRGDGLSVETVPVPFEFQPGADEMLVVSGVEAYGGERDRD